MTNEFCGSGIYRHYKGGHYTALFVGRHHDTQEPMVAYVSHQNGMVFFRELSSWNEEVELPDGTKVPRFQGFYQKLPHLPEGRVSLRSGMSEESELELGPNAEVRVFGQLVQVGENDKEIVEALRVLFENGRKKQRERANGEERWGLPGKPQPLYVKPQWLLEAEDFVILLRSALREDEWIAPKLGPGSAYHSNDMDFFWAGPPSLIFERDRLFVWGWEGPVASTKDLAACVALYRRWFEGRSAS